MALFCDTYRPVGIDCNGQVHGQVNRVAGRVKGGGVAGDEAGESKRVALALSTSHRNLIFSFIGSKDSHGSEYQQFENAIALLQSSPRFVECALLRRQLSPIECSDSWTYMYACACFPGPAEVLRGCMLSSEPCRCA